MKIGLICPYDIYKNGGVQECVKALRIEFNKLGHEAYIITPKPKNHNYEQTEGIILVGQSRDVKSPFHTTAQVSASFDNEEIDEVLSKYKFDVLHFHEPWVPIVGRQILTRSNTVNIATFHAKLPETMMSKTIEKVITPYTKSILKFIDANTAVSDAAADYVSSLTKDSITIIPNGIDYEKFAHNTHAKSQTNTILYIGRLEKRKGLIYLLKAFALLKKSDNKIKLLIAGDGPDKQKLMNFIDTNQIKDVEFLGFVDESKKINLLQTATIYCSPAIYGESFGIVLLEAMAAGTVTVAGNNPGYVSVMSGTGSLSIVNVKDTVEFTRKLSLLMTNQDIRKLWTDWASTYVKQFNYKTIAQDYIEVYKKAIRLHKK